MQNIDYSKPFCCYETTNKTNGKIYRGKGKTKAVLEGRYIGSGHRLHIAIQKYGRENFSSKIIATFDSEEEAYAFEKQFVILNYDISYNLVEGGVGSLISNKIKMHKGDKEIFVDKSLQIRFEEEGYSLGLSDKTLQKHVDLNTEELKEKRKQNRCIKYGGDSGGQFHTKEAMKKSKETRLARYGNCFGKRFSAEEYKTISKKSLVTRRHKYGHNMGRACEKQFHEKSAQTNKVSTVFRTEVASYLGIPKWKVKEHLKSLGYVGKVGIMCKKFLDDINRK